ncbi:hypothetical protein B0H13DRAFT_1920953 [Mycena leptocephala]|nr:hypothetical protein B0H13DRAFT_1920953 [Mycena leptocephala]
MMRNTRLETRVGLSHTALVDIPDEILLDIFSRLPREDVMSLLRRYGLLRSRVLEGTRLLETSQGRYPPSLDHGLPCLRGLRLRGGTFTAGALLCHRPVEELVLSTPLGYQALNDLCCLVDRSLYGHRMVTLIIRLSSACAAQDALVALAEVMPNLEQLSVDQPDLDSMSVLSNLVGSNALLKHIRRLSLNVASSRISGKIDDEEMSVWLASHVASESSIVAISVGGTVWSLDILTYTWVASARLGTIIVLRYLTRHM